MVEVFFLFIGVGKWTDLTIMLHGGMYKMVFINFKTVSTFRWGMIMHVYYALSGNFTLI